MPVIEFVPKNNHFIAEEYAHAIVAKVLSTTGIRGTVSYEFLPNSTNRCTFSIHYAENAPSACLGPASGVYCGAPTDLSVIDSIANSAIRHIAKVVSIVCDNVPNIDLLGMIGVMHQLFGDLIESDTVLYKFILDEITGGNK